MWCCEGCRRAWVIRSMRLSLEVTPDRRIVRIVIQGVDGASTEYRFTDQKEDTAVDGFAVCV